MGFCAVSDMAAFLQVAIDPANVSALRAIDEATAAIQDYCEQTIELVEDDEYTFDVATRQTKLFLPELPVTEVSKVEEDGDELTVTDDYKLGNHGILYRIDDFWYEGIQTVTVTYSHGYLTIPRTVKDVCTRAAARAFQAGLTAAMLAGVSGLRSGSLGAYSVTLADGTTPIDGSNLGASGAVILLPSEKRMLDRYKRERI